MLTGSISGDLDDMLNLLGDRIRKDVDEEMRRLADEVGALVVEGNRRGILDGIDAQGRPFAPLAESTLKNKRRGNGRVLAPHGEMSRTISGLTAKVTVIDDTRFKVSVSYPGFTEVIRYIEAGTKFMPPRPVLGIRPDDATGIQALLDAAARRIAERFG